MEFTNLFASDSETSIAKFPLVSGEQIYIPLRIVSGIGVIDKTTTTANLVLSLAHLDFSASPSTSTVLFRIVSDNGIIGKTTTKANLVLSLALLGFSTVTINDNVGLAGMLNYEAREAKLCNLIFLLAGDWVVYHTRMKLMPHGSLVGPDA